MKQTSLSSGAVPVRFQKGQWEFLILRTYSYWDFPKGMVEAGENPWEAALREVFEETGLLLLDTPWGQDFFETGSYGKGKVARYYLVRSLEDKEILLSPNPVTGIIEHHDYKWLPYPEARKRMVPRVQEVIDWAFHKLQSSNS
jgi:8-oxo-dGTP pyrophosphatase MutT (NUDIX family)